MSEKLFTEQVMDLDNLMQHHRAKMDEHQRKADSHCRMRNTAATLLERLRERACGGCSGFGKVSVSYAQDDVRVETCPACDGSGEKSDD